MMELLRRRIEERRALIAKLPVSSAGQMEMGVSQWQERISAVCAETAPTLDLRDAVVAFVSMLAHLAVATGRTWQ
jgi:hypothetical protein